jgi:hypothetical protein
VPALVYLALLFLLDVAQPVLFMQEKLAAAGTLDNVAFVGVPGVLHELIVFLEPDMAFLALVSAEEAHEIS